MSGEILTGLVEGDQVVLPTGGALEGDRLRIREARKPKVSGVQVPQGMTR